MYGGASNAIGQYQPPSRLRCRRCGRKSYTASTTRLTVPQHAGSRGSSPDEFPEIRFEDEWPPPPRYAEAGDRCPRRMVHAESISWRWPLPHMAPLFRDLASANDPIALTFRNLNPCLALTVNFPGSAAGIGSG